jgi:hypothetical protein
VLNLPSETVNQIKKAFSIESDDPKEIRKELIKKMAAVYPKTGPFNSGADEKQYYLISVAIEKIDAEIDVSKALICIDDLKKSLSIPSENDSKKEIIRIEQQKTFDKRIETSIINYKSRIFFPRVTLTTLTGILSFIWFFPSLVAGNPFFSFLSIDRNMDSGGYIAFSFLWMIILLITLQVWMITAVNEFKKKDFYSKLQFESNQNELFYRFFDEGELLEEGSFFKRHFTDFLMENSERIILRNDSPRIPRNFSSKSALYIVFLSLFSWRPLLMEYEIADSIADIILTKALNKGLLKIEDSEGLEDIYVLCSRKSNSS